MKTSKTLWGFLMLSSIVFTACDGQKAQTDTDDEEDVSAEMVEYIRVNADESSSALRVLHLYAYGEAIIQSFDCMQPQSWYYQGSIHHVPARNEISGPVVELCNAYEDSTDIQRGWNSCPHMWDTDKQLHFLTWHRLYIYYYERNLRYYIANGAEGFPGLGWETANQFSLPYWDYTNDPKMAAPFRNEAQTYEYEGINGNPLYFKGRSRTLNAGIGIDYSSTDSIAINIGNGVVKNLCLRTMEQSLDYDLFLAISDVSEFSRGMEDRLHNVMHDYIGGAVDPIDKRGEIYNIIYQNAKSGFGLMGQIPSAGFDPIFFLHHSNVDRLFASWEEMYGPITIEEMNEYGGTWEETGHIYEFWDAESSSWITYNSMQEMLDAAHAVDYRYESYASLDQEGFEAVRDNTPSVEGEVVYDMEEADPNALSETGSPFNIPLSEAVTASEDDAKFSLEIDISFGQDMFQQLVVFSLPPNMDWDACDLDPAYVHSINAFFGSTHHMAGHGGMEHEMEGQEYEHQLIVDVTQAIQNLPVGENLQVYIVPINTENSDGNFFVTDMRIYKH